MKRFHPQCSAVNTQIGDKPATRGKSARIRTRARAREREREREREEGDVKTLRSYANVIFQPRCSGNSLDSTRVYWQLHSSRLDESDRSRFAAVLAEGMPCDLRRTRQSEI